MYVSFAKEAQKNRTPSQKRLNLVCGDYESLPPYRSTAAAKKYLGRKYAGDAGVYNLLHCLFHCLLHCISATATALFVAEIRF